MSERLVYFAYGSNMAIERLRSRVPSAQTIGVGILAGHRLAFHKRSRHDHSGKCDATRTGAVEDRVFGVLYTLEARELLDLDRHEGRGNGYERATVTIVTQTRHTLEAQTYLATHIEPGLRPLDWYKTHVLRGARDAGLPVDYVARIEAVVADVDPDVSRRVRELAIYG